MTKPLDPQMSALIAAITQQVTQQLRSEMQRAADPDRPPLREAAKEWLRMVLDVPRMPHQRGRTGNRAAPSHMPLVLDLEFDHEGKKIKLGDLPVNRIDVRTVEAWRRKLKSVKCRATVAPKPGEEWRELDKIISPGYRNRLLTTLQSIVSYALEGHSPLRGMKRESTKHFKRKGCFQTEQHLAAFVAHLPPWLADMAWLAAGPGCMRLAEVLHLTKSEVNWEAKSITLPPHRTKNREGRTFPVSDADMEMLRARAIASGRSPYIFAKQSIDKTSREHMPFHPSHVSKLMRRAAIASGIRLGPGAGWTPTFHFLRRTGATWTLLRSDNTFRLQKNGGWKDPAVMNDYLDETKDMIDESEELANVAPSVALERRRQSLKTLKGGGGSAPPAAPAVEERPLLPFERSFPGRKLPEEP